MKLYQSITQTLPSGPTSATIGEVHSSSLASRFQALCECEVAAPALEGERGDEVAGRLGDEGRAVPVVLRVGPGGVERVAGARR